MQCAEHAFLVLQLDRSLGMLSTIHPSPLPRLYFAQSFQPAASSVGRLHLITQPIFRFSKPTCSAGMEAGQLLGLQLTIPHGCEPRAPLIVSTRLSGVWNLHTKLPLDLGSTTAAACFRLHHLARAVDVNSSTLFPACSSTGSARLVWGSGSACGKVQRPAGKGGLSLCAGRSAWPRRLLAAAFPSAPLRSSAAQLSGSVGSSRGA